MRPRGFYRRLRVYLLFLIVVVTVVIGMVLLLRYRSSADTLPSERYHNGRFGFGVARAHPSQYDVGMLNAGWYLDWRACITPTLPSLDYVLTIGLSPTETGYAMVPTPTVIAEVAAAHPGAMWLIGNEPDCMWQDNMRSDLYAQAYHDLYAIVKTADPTAQIGAGSIVQPTPQRLRYLDRVLETYEQMYGEPLPADFWATHSYILCENCFPRRPGDPFPWGACPVPDWPDDPEDAVYYSVHDHWRLDIFQERLVAFRQWMYDHDYRNRPLVVSEYGILFYDGLVEGKTIEDDVVFMRGTFDWMREARDPVIGYPADDNRLVQRWAWFSLDHDWWYMGGALFDYVTHQPLEMGLAYADYTVAITPTADLLLRVQAAPVQGPAGEPVTATLLADISNAGNVETAGTLTLTLSTQPPDATGEGVIDGTDVRQLSCCGDGEAVEFVWPDLTDGSHPFCAYLATSEEKVEVTTCGFVLVNPRTFYLPLVAH